MSAETDGDAMSRAYERAQRNLLITESKGVLNHYLYPRWVEGEDAFVYECDSEHGREFRLFDVQRVASDPLFDHAALAVSLADLLNAEPFDPASLPISHVYRRSDSLIEFKAFARHFRFDPAEPACVETMHPDIYALQRPGFDQHVIAKDHNLFLRSADGSLTALTTDGLEHSAYGVGFGCSRIAVHIPAFQAPPDALWSPDGRFLATLLIHEERVQELPVVEYAPRGDDFRPRLHKFRAAFPGDEHVPTAEIVVINIESGEKISAKWPALPAVRMNDTPLKAGRLFWTHDSKRLCFIDIERGEQRVSLVEMDPGDGSCRCLHEEQSESFIDLSLLVYTGIYARPVPEADELIWYSERSGWGHLYLLDLSTGKLKRQLTSGDWRVMEIIGFHLPTRRLLFTASGIDRGNPYRSDIMSVSLDEGDAVRLTADDANHRVLTPSDFLFLMFDMLGYDPRGAGSLSPSGKYIVDTMGWIDRLPITVLRSASDGRILGDVQSATGPGLIAGTNWPERFSIPMGGQADDIWGVMIKPPGYDPDLKYPVIDYAYGGPQTIISPVVSFDGLGRGGFLLEANALAALGFVVVMVDGRGTAFRSKGFQDHVYGQVHKASDAADHVAAIRHLAEREPGLDLDRVGVMGFSAGGYFAANAMFRFPDFYKAGVAAGGNYDQRLFVSAWGERYHGMPDRTDYSEQASASSAQHLKGKLLIVHGMLDVGCYPAAMFQLVDALIEQNRDFDLLMLPNEAHGINSYAQRRSWDYLVRHVMQASPPAGFRLKSVGDSMIERSQTMAAFTMRPDRNEA